MASSIGHLRVASEIVSRCSSVAARYERCIRILNERHLGRATLTWTAPRA